MDGWTQGPRSRSHVGPGTAHLATPGPQRALLATAYRGSSPRAWELPCAPLPEPSWAGGHWLFPPGDKRVSSGPFSWKSLESGGF